MVLDTDDLLIAIFIALVIIIILACARYGLRGSDLEGYWGTFGGDQFRIRTYKGGNITVTGPRFQARGVIRPLRGVCIGDGEQTKCGSVSLDGRWLTWGSGGLPGAEETWIKQGTKNKNSSALKAPLQQ